MIIMGIDPGTAITGYGVVEHLGNRFRVVCYGCVKTTSTQPLPERLKRLYNQLTAIIKETKPDVAAVEELFFNKNVRTALVVAHARGVAVLAASLLGLPVYEYTPLQVKQAVVGYGRADKVQIQFMVKTILGLKETPKPDDVADALAVAICHAHTGGVMRG